MAKYCCPLKYHAGRTPAATALWLSERRISYDELDRLVMEVQRQLRATGLQLGSHLAVISHNSLESLLLLMACLRSGIVFIPLNPRFPDRQLEGLLASLDCTAYYLDEPMREQTLNLSGMRVVTLQLPTLVNTCGGQSPFPNMVMDDERVCDLILTSGSSGQPKAAAHCYHHHYHSALGSQVLIPLAEGDAWLLSLPLYHVGGYAIVIRCLLAGAAMVLLSPKQNLAALLKSVPVTHLSLVNTQLYRLFTEPGTPLLESRLKLILMGGGYVSSDLVKCVEAQGIRILTSYGLTETSSLACTGKPIFLDRQRLTSGRLLPYRQIKISGEDEILVRGEVLFMGYYRSGGVYHLPVEHGWFATGDLGYLTDYGDLVVTGRRDNRFISGGENIQPEEIETVLLSLKGVRQAVVVSVPDEAYGRRPVAFVDCDSPDDNLNGLRSELALNLACFKLPEWIYSWPEDWTDGRLKVNRRLFRALAERRISHPSTSPR